MATRRYRLSAPCPNCGHQMALDDSIGDWIRAEPRLDSGEGFVFMDRDLIVHRYKTDHGREVQYLMFVEVKTRSAQLTPSQRDTIGLLSQIIRNRNNTPTKRNPYFQSDKRIVKVFSVLNGAWIKVRLLGYHVLYLDGDDPDSSHEMKWNRRPITKDDLIRLLRCELDPDTFQPMNNRSHHKQRLLPLQELKP